MSDTMEITKGDFREVFVDHVKMRLNSKTFMLDVQALVLVSPRTLPVYVGNISFAVGTSKSEIDKMIKTKALEIVRNHEKKKAIKKQRKLRRAKRRMARKPKGSS